MRRQALLFIPILLVGMLHSLNHSSVEAGAADADTLLDELEALEAEDAALDRFADQVDSIRKLLATLRDDSRTAWEKGDKQTLISTVDQQLTLLAEYTDLSPFASVMKTDRMKSIATRIATIQSRVSVWDEDWVVFPRGEDERPSIAILFDWHHFWVDVMSGWEPRLIYKHYGTPWPRHRVCQVSREYFDIHTRRFELIMHHSYDMELQIYDEFTRQVANNTD